MDNSLKNGFMAVFAVSGSVVFLTMQAHKRLLSDFKKKMEFEIHQSTGTQVKDEARKKVRFADDVTEFAAEKAQWNVDDETLEAMPENWQVMYKGIMECRNNLNKAYI